MAEQNINNNERTPNASGGTNIPLRSNHLTPHECYRQFRARTARVSENSTRREREGWSEAIVNKVMAAAHFLTDGGEILNLSKRETAEDEYLKACLPPYFVRKVVLHNRHQLRRMGSKNFTQLTVANYYKAEAIDLYLNAKFENGDLLKNYTTPRYDSSTRRSEPTVHFPVKELGENVMGINLFSFIRNNCIIPPHMIKKMSSWTHRHYRAGSLICLDERKDPWPYEASCIRMVRGNPVLWTSVTATKAKGGQFPIVLGCLPYHEKGNPSFRTVLSWATRGLAVPTEQLTSKKLLIWDSFYLRPSDLSVLEEFDVYYLAALNPAQWDYIIGKLNNVALDPRSYAITYRTPNTDTPHRQQTVLVQRSEKGESKALITNFFKCTSIDQRKNHVSEPYVLYDSSFYYVDQADSALNVNRSRYQPRAKEAAMFESTAKTFLRQNCCSLLQILRPHPNFTVRMPVYTITYFDMCIEVAKGLMEMFRNGEFSSQELETKPEESCPCKVCKDQPDALSLLEADLPVEDDSSRWTPTPDIVLSEPSCDADLFSTVGGRKLNNIREECKRYMSETMKNAIGAGAAKRVSQQLLREYHTLSVSLRANKEKQRTRRAESSRSSSSASVNSSSTMEEELPPPLLDDSLLDEFVDEETVPMPPDATLSLPPPRRRRNNIINSEEGETSVTAALQPTTTGSDAQETVEREESTTRWKGKEKEVEPEDSRMDVEVEILGRGRRKRKKRQPFDGE